MSDGPKVLVRYTCFLCGITDQEVAVEERGPDQDVVDWTRVTMGNALGADHKARSPSCTTAVLSQVKIPIADPKNVRVGAARRN